MPRSLLSRPTTLDTPHTKGPHLNRYPSQTPSARALSHLKIHFLTLAPQDPLSDPPTSKSTS
eukprot:scaffold2658_cov98-Isochrysis_galbana.AAC.2